MSKSRAKFLELDIPCKLPSILTFLPLIDKSIIPDISILLESTIVLAAVAEFIAAFNSEAFVTLIVSAKALLLALIQASTITIVTNLYFLNFLLLK